MRNLRRTEAFDEFYNTLDEKTQEKVDYALTIVSQINVVSSKFIKKLENTEFYELRVSFGNEYRIILFTIDKDSIIEA